MSGVRGSSATPVPTWAPVAIVAAGVAGYSLGPAAGAIGPLRRALLPGYAGVGRPGHVALTFDDGPHHSSTPQFLDLLDRWRIRATFFMVGESVQADPGLAREVRARGHELAVHGWRHTLLLRRRPAAVTEDITRARHLIAELADDTPRWYRPPYGVATPAALRTARDQGMCPVLWTAWGRDWTHGASAGSVVRAVQRRAGGGATVLLHDTDTFAASGSWRATLGALPRLLGDWQAQGLQVGPLADHDVTARPNGA